MTGAESNYRSRPWWRAILFAAVLATQAFAQPPVDEIAITTNQRPWLSETDFDTDGTLHATVRQSVLLDLESGGRGTGNVHGNILRLQVEKPRQFSLCLAADEPHIVRAQLTQNAQKKGAGGSNSTAKGRKVATWQRGGRCDPVPLAAGSYTMEVFHDTRQVPPGGAHAFFYNPQQTAVMGDSASPATLAFMVFKGPDGNYVSADDFVGGAAYLETVDSVVDASSVWQIVDGPTPFGLENGNSQRVNIMVNEPGQQCFTELYIGSQGGGPICGDTPVQLNMKGTPYSFGLSAVGANTEYSSAMPVLAGSTVNENNYVQYSLNPSDSPAIMSADYRGFRCANDNCAGGALVLQEGEVALFAQCNFMGPAVVFHTDVPDLSIYDTVAALGLGMGDNSAASVRVGPDTLAVLHGSAQFGGTSFSTASDVTCLDGTSIGSGEASSLQIIQEAAAHVVATNACVNCNLSGIDLAGADLTGGDFAGTNFTGADLTATSLPLAKLNTAILVGAMLDSADFTGADLRCADFSGADLTTVYMGRTEMFPVVGDSGLAAVVAIDPSSGGRTILSGPGVGSGPPLTNLLMVRGDDAGSLLAATAGSNPAVIRITYAGSDRTIVSGTGVGSGTAFGTPVDLAVTADGTLLVLDSTRGLFQVDQTKGNRTIVSGPRTGSGPGLLGTFGMSLDTDGTVVVAAGAVGVLRVNLTTGDRTQVSGSGMGTGTAFGEARAVTIAPDGSLLVADSVLGAVLRVDPATGNRTLLSGAGAGSGPVLIAPTGIAVSASGQLLVVDEVLFGIDPVSGARTIVSGTGVGGGPDFDAPVSVAVFDPSPSVNTTCRLILHDATLALDTFPLSYWRSLDLSGATIEGVADATLSTADAPLDLHGAILSKVDFGSATLDSINLGCYPSVKNQTEACPPANGTPSCAVLQGTGLSGASLKNACLNSASLQGADLSFANLEGSDLGSATLAALSTGSPATLYGAFLRDASLHSANLTGVIANFSNFYSSVGGSADATNATMTGSKWNNAYLAGADFSSAVLQSTEWNGAVLVGTNFNGAKLQKNTTAGEITDFNGAYLQGAVFSNAVVDNADFTSSYWDLDISEGESVALNFLLQPGNLEFAGYWNSPAAPECVQAVYPNPNYPSAITPITSASNICPDGHEGPCDGLWDQPATPIEDATPESAVDPDLPGTCTETDIFWIYNLD